MKALNCAVVFVAAILMVSFGCANDGPTAPSTPGDTAVSTPVNAPSAAVRSTPASFDATSSLRHDINDGFNAYDFTATYDGSMLTLTLTEDEMRSMREASKPHRNRTITVGICPNEPRRISQACGDPIWQGSMRLADRLTLPAIPLASCNGWIVVNAAELYDDRYDGWRNAPCPRPDSEPVGSDGTGTGWPNYNEFECGEDDDIGDPRRNQACEQEKEQVPPPPPLSPPSRWSLTYESGWDGRVGPILPCLVTGGTVANFCFDGDEGEIRLLLGVGSRPGPPRFGPGPGMGNPDNTETMGRQQAVVRYNASPAAGWTTEQARLASARRYVGFLAPLACEAEGGIYRQGSVEVFPAVNPTRLAGAVDGWEYTPNRTQTGYNYGARPVYQWRATCDEPPR